MNAVSQKQGLRHFLPPISLWVMLVVVSLVWNLREVEKYTTELALDRARSLLAVLQTHRLWNASHGGVYVPVNAATRPNPYLEEDPLRDISVAGMVLTRINPAYMTRQVAELARARQDVVFHMTSLRPIRPENAPDPWEEAALLRMEGEREEVFARTTMDNEPYYRFMAPVFVEESCLQCHARQGYRIGDVRGGVSASIPVASFAPLRGAQRLNLLVLHGLVLLIGLGAIAVAQGRALRDEATINRSLREKEMLLREMHHRVKNNLMVVQSLLMLQSEEARDEHSRRMLLESRSRVTSMAMIHERLSRATDLRHVNLAEYVRELARALFDAYRTGDADISLRLDIGDVTADVESMIPCGLILNELISNALKYAFPGGRSGEIAVSLARRPGGAIALSVADDGAGLPEGFVLPEGRSLGMNIISTLANQLGGRIAIESRGGARFTLVFSDTAIGTEGEGASPAPVASGRWNAQPSGGLRILLAEDNSINSMMIDRVLASEGHEVSAVGSGDKVLDALRAGRFDLVLLDVLMPGMDGVETVRSIRADRSGAFRPDIPVIAITGLDSAEDLMRLREAGMDAHIVKPIDHAALKNSLARLRNGRMV